MYFVAYSDSRVNGNILRVRLFMWVSSNKKPKRVAPTSLTFLLLHLFSFLGIISNLFLFWNFNFNDFWNIVAKWDKKIPHVRVYIKERQNGNDQKENTKADTKWSQRLSTSEVIALNMTCEGSTKQQTTTKEEA